MKRIRISLRGLLICLSLGCLLCGWLASEYRVVKARKEFWPNFNDHNFSVRSMGLYPPESAEVPVIRRWLGDSPTPTLIYSPRKDPEGKQLQRVRELFPESHIWGWPAEDDELPEGIDRLPDDRHGWI